MLRFKKEAKPFFVFGFAALPARLWRTGAPRKVFFLTRMSSEKTIRFIAPLASGAMIGVSSLLVKVCRKYIQKLFAALLIFC